MFKGVRPLLAPVAAGPRSAGKSRRGAEHDRESASASIAAITDERQRRREALLYELRKGYRAGSWLPDVVADYDAASASRWCAPAAA